MGLEVMAFMVVTYCAPAKPCVTEARGPIPMEQCQEAKRAVMEGEDGKPALRYDEGLTIECEETQSHGE